jgi:uncharacterized membrane protein YgdD (TMEM256/DUF423 family)
LTNVGKVDHSAASHDRFDQLARPHAVLGLFRIAHPIVAGQQRLLLDRGEIGSRSFAQGAASGFVIAASLFAGDLMLRQYAGHGLFPMAAPAGGPLLILSWVALAVSAMWPRR